jgi:DNA-directed RNA polymerase III subunit RPC3
MERARMIPRYPRYVEYAKKALDSMAAALVEELLVHGRLRTVDAVKRTVERVKATETSADSAEEPQSTNTTSSRYTSRQAVLESFKRLTQAGFLEQVPKLVDQSELERQEANAEFEFDAPAEPPRKKVKIQDDRENPSEKKPHEEEDPAIVNLLQGGAYKDILPRDAVWRVNLDMFHDSLRAFVLGRLVAERYGHRVQSAGSMVTAALKFLAHRRHAEKITDVEMTFGAADILRYIPKAVLQLLDKKRKESVTNKGTSVVTAVAKSLQQLSGFAKPLCVLEVETGGKPEHSKFEICVSRLVEYLQRRIIHQVIYDSHGEVASRIVTILTLNGHLESDSLADAAMVPAKDTREVGTDRGFWFGLILPMHFAHPFAYNTVLCLCQLLHRLYRAKYIELFTLNTSRQHNPSNMIYLWTVDGARVLRNVTDNVCTALLNLRLRRQHQIEIGKNWIDRAQEAGDMDENEHEADKLNHRKFCLGLERLYNSCLQLDETMMVLKDF